MNEPTPGPWVSQGWVPTWAYIPIKDARHNLVCSLHSHEDHNYTRDEVEANARLIVRAVNCHADLAAALERARLHVRDLAYRLGADSDEIAKACAYIDAALAKAGETE